MDEFQAQDKRLVSAKADKVLITVDNTSVLQGNAGRAAVRIESKKSPLKSQPLGSRAESVESHVRL